MTLGCLHTPYFTHVDNYINARGCPKMPVCYSAIFALTVSVFTRNMIKTRKLYSIPTKEIIDSKFYILYSGRACGAHALCVAEGTRANEGEWVCVPPASAGPCSCAVDLQLPSIYASSATCCALVGSGAASTVRYNAAIPVTWPQVK